MIGDTGQQVDQVLGSLGGGPGAIVHFLGEEDDALVGRVGEPQQGCGWGLDDSCHSCLTSGVAEGAGEAVVRPIAGPIRGRAAATHLTLTNLPINYRGNPNPNPSPNDITLNPNP